MHKKTVSILIVPVGKDKPVSFQVNPRLFKIFIGFCLITLVGILVFVIRFGPVTRDILRVKKIKADYARMNQLRDSLAMITSEIQKIHEYEKKIAELTGSYAPEKGEAKAAAIKAAIELGRRLSLEAPEERPAIHSPADVAALVQYEMSALEQEHFRVMLLNTRNQVLDIVELYQGSLNSSMIRVGEVFKSAVRRNAASVIVIHNHPSGDPTPSPDDTAVTKSIVSAGRLLDIDVLDHIIIGQKRFVSMKERGLGFET